MAAGKVGSEMGDAVVFFDPVYLEHKTGFGHPEKPERLTAAMEALKGAKDLYERLDVRAPRDAAREEVELVHRPEYIDLVRRVSESGGGNLDMDTSLSAASYRAALRAAGALLEGVEGICSGAFRRVFCLVRPPGHHALPGRGMGFCLLNNVALGARYAIDRAGLDRVMIVDWDAHHGNGTQDVFYEDPDVLYVSLHQYPHYPGSGAARETGGGPGAGLTINIPFPPGTGERHYLEAFDRLIIPAGRRFDPDLVMVSAGFDGHEGDLLCSMRLSDSSYRRMTERLAELAGECCGGGLIMALEGGYNIAAQSRSIVQVMSAMVGVQVPAEDEPPRPTSYPERADAVIGEVAALMGA